MTGQPLFAQLLIMTLFGLAILSAMTPVGAPFLTPITQDRQQT